MKKLAVLLLSLSVISYANSHVSRCRDDGDCGDPSLTCSFDTSNYLASTEEGECVKKSE